MQAIQLQASGQGFNVSGHINFANVTALRQQGRALLTQCEADIVHIDLSTVIETDNVGLALLSAWLKDAKQLNKTIQYQHMPSSLISMAGICGLTFLISDASTENG